MYIQDAKNHEGENVKINGWLYNSRSSGKIVFLLVRDGTGIVQCIISKADTGDEVFNLAKSLTQESSISVFGTLRKEERAPGGYELIVSNLELNQLAEEYPIALKEHGVDFLMSNRHLWLRSKRQWAIMRIRHTIIKSARDFFDNNGFTLIDSPILTPSACEGTTTLFETDYFGVPAYLSQSGQLYNEASAMAFGRVYCFGPTFRAEKSKTRRHLTEFWMIEPEMAYCSLEENMEIQENFVSYIVQRVLEERKEELEILERDTGKLEMVKPPFERISYNDAIKLLQSKGIDIKWGDDFGGDEETIISASFNKPVFVHHFPKVFKAFYMKRDPEKPELVLGSDLLAPEGYGEIIGGGQREDNYDALLERIKEEKLRVEDYEWYLDLRKYGSVPHGGFGLGIERTVAWICSLKHVRETIPFARLLEKIYP